MGTNREFGGRVEQEVVTLSSDDEDEIIRMNPHHRNRTPAEISRIREEQWRVNFAHMENGANQNREEQPEQPNQVVNWNWVSSWPYLQPAGVTQGQISNAHEEGTIITTLEPSKCSFCSCDLVIGQGVVLDRCLHNFCRECIIAAIEQSTSPQILCPVTQETDCGGILLDPEVKALVSPSYFQTYLNRSLKLLVDENRNVSRSADPNSPIPSTSTGSGSHGLGSGGSDLNLVSCSNSACSGFGDVSNVVEFKCGQCGLINCLICKTVREGSIQSCEECLTRLPANKKAKIEYDPEVAKDWEAKWNQLTASVAVGSSTETEAGPSSSNGTPGCSRDADVLLALSMGMQETQLLLSQQEFDCPICFCEVSKGEGVILKDCFHLFCKTCLTALIEHSEGATVPCPHRINEDVCKSMISDREIKSLVSSEFYETFLRRSVRQAEMGMKNSYHCKTVNCESFWEMDYAEMTGEVPCPACKRKNCLRCQAVHEAVTCEEYRERLIQDEMDIQTKALLQEKVTQGLVMKCPTCKVMIEKNGGCPHMFCSFCRTDFQWSAQPSFAAPGRNQDPTLLHIPVGRGMPVRGRGRGRGRGIPIPQPQPNYPGFGFFGGGQGPPPVPVQVRLPVVGPSVAAVAAIAGSSGGQNSPGIPPDPDPVFLGAAGLTDSGRGRGRARSTRSRRSRRRNLYDLLDGGPGQNNQ